MNKNRDKERCMRRKEEVAIKIMRKRWSKLNTRVSTCLKLVSFILHAFFRYDLNRTSKYKPHPPNGRCLRGQVVQEFKSIGSKFVSFLPSHGTHIHTYINVYAYALLCMHPSLGCASPHAQKTAQKLLQTGVNLYDSTDTVITGIII